VNKFIEFTEFYTNTKMSIDVSSIISVMQPVNSGTRLSTAFYKYEVIESYQEVLDMIDNHVKRNRWQ
jgi:hypothetical protein